MAQNQAQAFSGGLESASYVASSGILTSLWNHISNLYAEAQYSNQNLFWKIGDESGLTIITFWTSQNHDQLDLLPLSNTDDNRLRFICSEKYPNFSLNHFAISLFNQNGKQLDQLKSETDLKKPVIVTGHGGGGSIASLFTLWLLEKMNPTSDKRPLCITFGSPLIGDQSFQEAIWKSSNWNSCFLHVASLLDPLVSSSISNNLYSPFGIYLLCSDYGSSCFESPGCVRLLLNLTSQLNNQGLQQNYGSIVENLHRKAICKDFDGPNISHSNLLQESFALQLCALGFPQLLQLQETLMESLVEERNKEVLKQEKRFIPNKKLDAMKIEMAKLEWYKKGSKKRGIGYYDMFKYQPFTSDVIVNEFIGKLNLYWKEMVEEAEKQPQKEGATFRTRWLYAGTNYRRMVEPLDIAGYYNKKDGKRDYINKGRPEHYKQLEKWLKEDKKCQSIGRTNNVESILTLDSCFWAHVEEALISCQKLKATESNEAEKLEAINSLSEFEKYVYGSLKDYAVSPEIFLERSSEERSSFMRWWSEYIGIKGASHDTELANFMKNPTNYKKYMEGAYTFP